MCDKWLGQEKVDEWRKGMMMMEKERNKGWCGDHDHNSNNNKSDNKNNINNNKVSKKIKDIFDQIFQNNQHFYFLLLLFFFNIIIRGETSSERSEEGDRSDK